MRRYLTLGFSFFILTTLAGCGGGIKSLEGKHTFYKSYFTQEYDKGVQYFKPGLQSILVDIGENNGSYAGSATFHESRTVTLELASVRVEGDTLRFNISPPFGGSFAGMLYHDDGIVLGLDNQIVGVSSNMPQEALGWIKANPSVQKVTPDMTFLKEEKGTEAGLEAKYLAAFKDTLAAQVKQHANDAGLTEANKAREQKSIARTNQFLEQRIQELEKQAK